MEPYGWLLVVAAIILASLGILRRYYTKYLSQLISNFLSCYEASRNYKLKNISYLTSSIWLWIIFFLNAGLLIYFSVNHFFQFHMPLPSIVYIVFFASVFLLLYATKLLLYILTGLLTDETAIIKEYLFSWNTISKTTGLALTPISFTIGFIHPHYQIYGLYVAYTLYFLTYLYRLYRGLCIIHTKKFFYLYILLYFCTVEMIPVLILVFSINRLL